MGNIKMTSKRRNFQCILEKSMKTEIYRKYLMRDLIEIVLNSILRQRHL